MTKRELIDEIVVINRSADPAFLAKFDDVELLEYLDHLQYTKQLNLTDTQPRWDRHLQPVAAAPFASGDRLWTAGARDCPDRRRANGPFGQSPPEQQTAANFFVLAQTALTNLR